MYNDQSTFFRRASEMLSYSQLSGVFTWRVPIRFTVKTGDISGTVNVNGYRVIRLDGKDHRAHRLAWLLVHGDWPKHQIDHINGIKDDNRIANLRDVTPAQNTCNRVKAMTTSGSGLLGVVQNKATGKWMTYITRNKKTKALGTFATKEAAHDVYIKARTDELVNVFGPESPQPLISRIPFFSSVKGI